MEKHRLLNWSQVAGLVDDKGPTLTTTLRLNRTLVMDILFEIRRLLQSFGKIDGRYAELKPIKGADDARAVEQERLLDESVVVVEASVVLRGRLGRGIERAKKMALSAIDNAPSTPKRLRWAQFDSPKFESLLTRLKELNDFMHGLMDDNQSKELLHTQRQTLMETLQLHNSIAELKQLVRALSTSDSAAAAAQARSTGRNAPADMMERQIEQRESIAHLAQFKEFNLGLDSPEKRAKTELRPDDITYHGEPESRPSDRRVEAVYQPEGQRPKHVWIEWKEYDPVVWLPDQQPDEKILERVQHLAALLQSDKPEKFRAPHCLGYFDDRNGEGNCRFGFVFEKPEDVDASTKPVSLLECFKDLDKPSLTDRIGLARKIASCILYLHSVNWLHKGLRSHNIVFFPTESTGYEKPYLSGFDYARPAKSDEVTEKPPENPEFDVYRHPKAHGSGPRENDAPNPFKKSYDIYSLGVVLLEIAYWRSIDDILGIADIKLAKPPQTERVQSRLLNEAQYLGTIRADTGDVYHGVVSACLRAAEGFNLSPSADETKEDVAAELQQGFTERVIEKLDGLDL